MRNDMPDGFNEGPAPMLTISGTLTVAEIMALNSTPVEIIPAPPGNQYIYVACVHWWLEFNTTDYGGGGNGNLRAYYTSNPNNEPSTQSAMRAELGEQGADVHLVAQARQTLLVPQAGERVEARTANAWTTGDSEIHYEIRYLILPFEF